MSFSCRDVHARWPEYLYRELDEREQGKFVQHLQKCPRCRMEESQWRDLLSRFDIMAVSDGNTEPPRELVFRVKRQVQLYEDWSHQIFTQFRNRLLGCAAACALFFGGVHLVKSQLSALSDPNAILKPIAESVLNSLYDKDTLRTLCREGLFETETAEKPNAIADLTGVADDKSKPAGKSPDRASQKQS